MEVDGDDVVLVAIAVIAGQEITTNYRETLGKLKPTESVRDSISRLETSMAELPQADIPVIHHFAHGIYGREMRAAAGTVIVGKIHKTHHLNILAQGRIAVVSETGGHVEMQAPAVFVSPPGTKRAIWAISDCVFINVHGTHETDLEKIEEEFIAPDFMALESEDIECLG